MKKDRNRVIGGPLDGECVSLIEFAEFRKGEYLFLAERYLPDIADRPAMHHYVEVNKMVAYVGVKYEAHHDSEADARQAGLILGMVRG